MSGGANTLEMLHISQNTEDPNGSCIKVTPLEHGLGNDSSLHPGFTVA
jgi:hypothetical protein